MKPSRPLLGEAKRLTAEQDINDLTQEDTNDLTQDDVHDPFEEEVTVSSEEEVELSSDSEFHGRMSFRMKMTLRKRIRFHEVNGVITFHSKNQIFFLKCYLKMFTKLVFNLPFQ